MRNSPRLLLILLLASRAFGSQSVLTQHNDNQRSGANTAETVLTPANVTPTTFGKLFSRTLDANVNGQVLYVPNLTIQGAAHNVIFASTSNNSNNSPSSVYAFDADDPNLNTFLWRTPMTNASRWTTCTPAIDLADNIIFVLTKDVGSGGNDDGPTKLHALDLTTGGEKTGSPVTLQATVAGTGDGSSNGMVSFNTAQANCRPGLLFANGAVYLGFAHNSDSFPYHGWIFKYTYDGTQFTQSAVFNTAPNGGLSGIWQSGKGLVADASGNIYCTVGNGTFNPTASPGAYGMCVLKLNSALTVLDWFAPSNYQAYSDADQDLGDAGAVLIPGTTRLFAGGTKYGHGHLIESNNMGHVNTPASAPDACLQTITGLSSNVRQTPIAWAGPTTFVYLWGSGQPLTAYKYDPAAFLSVAGTRPAATAGGSLTVTSNQTNSGILWALENNDGASTNIFHAYDATNLATELWNSSQNSTRDTFGGTVGHWQFPTVVNGKAYIPTGSASIVCYGLLNAAPHIVSATAVSSTQVAVKFDKPLDPASANLPANYAINNGVTVSTAALAADSVTVNLSISTLAPNTYTLTVNAIKSANSDPIAPNSTATFTFPATTTAFAFTSLSASPNPWVVNYAVSFSASTNASDAVFSWDFGDGSAGASGASTTHIYTAEGNYTVTVTAQSASFNATISQTISVQISNTATLPGTQKITSIHGSLRFGKTTDQLSLNATFSVPANTVASGAAVLLTLNGLSHPVTLDTHGRATVSGGTVSFRTSTLKGISTGHLSLHLKGALKAPLSTGLTQNASGLPVSLLLRIDLQGASYSAIIPLQFKQTGSTASAQIKVAN